MVIAASGRTSLDSVPEDDIEDPESGKVRRKSAQ